MTDELNYKLQMCIRNKRFDLVEIVYPYEFDTTVKFDISEENKEHLKRFDLSVEIIPLVILGEKTYRYRVVSRKEKIHHLMLESIGTLTIVLFFLTLCMIPVVLYLKVRGIIQ